MVVLIIGILLGVATPSLIGARRRAQDASARSSLRSTATTAIMLSEFRSDFSLATPAALALAEPAVTYVAATEPSTGPKVVSVDASANGRWAAVVMSVSGTCFATVVEAGCEVTVESNSCVAADVDADVPDPPAAPATPGGGTSSIPVLHVDAPDALLTGNMTLVAGTVGVPDAGSYAASPAATTSSASFVFNVTEADDYSIYASVASFGGTSDSFWVQIDGQPSAGFLWDTGTGVMAVRDRYLSPQTIVVTLYPGQHVVTIFQREDGPTVAWMELRPA